MDYETKVSTLGERIVKFREGLHMSQETLALHAGLHRPRLSLIERGQVVPRLDELMWLADVLEAPLSVLIPEGYDFDMSAQEVETIFWLRQIKDDGHRAVIARIVRDYACSGGRE